MEAGAGNQRLESLQVPLSKQDAALLAEIERQSPSLALVAYRDLVRDAEARLAEVEAALGETVNALTRMPDAGLAAVGDPRYAWWWHVASPALGRARAALNPPNEALGSQSG